MMLALGDALAVALMGRRGFSHDDYRVLHPGGSIGQSLIKIGDIMRTGDALPVVAPDTKMDAVIKEMTAKAKGFTCVVDADKKLAGIITDGDLRRHMSDALLRKNAGDIMTKSPKTISRDAVVGEALHLMYMGGPRPILVLIVTEGERAIGFVELHDCLRAGVR
jgi:arabinose-5-phosphate isomerase